ncbi:MAG: hypothetical protein AAGD09_18805 [Cyanobacteria bacterium P01_F01_bin.56]
MRRSHHHSFLFRAACEGFKLLALMFAGFICACLFLAPFGPAVQVAVLVQTAMPFFVRLTASLISLIIIAGLLESLE